MSNSILFNVGPPSWDDHKWRLEEQPNARREDSRKLYLLLNMTWLVQGNFEKVPNRNQKLNILSGIPVVLYRSK